MWEDAHSLHEQFPISNLEDKLILRGWNIRYVSITKGRKQYGDQNKYGRRELNMEGSFY
jgi:hypothetical protein